MPTGPEAPAASVAAAAVAPLVFRAVSAGDTHTCGVTKDNRAWCWGDNFSGQLGDGTTINRVLPTPVAGGLSFRSVTAGRAHSCGITTDSRAYCWGSNNDGQLGAVTTRSRVGFPIAVGGGLAFRNVSAGLAHTCAVTTADRAYCWGENVVGTLGDGTRTPRSTPKPVADNRQYRNTDASQFYSCALTLAGRGICWGSNPRGELGNGTTGDRLRRDDRGPGVLLGG